MWFLYNEKSFKNRFQSSGGVKVNMMIIRVVVVTLVRNIQPPLPALPSVRELSI